MRIVITIHLSVKTKFKCYETSLMSETEAVFVWFLYGNYVVVGLLAHSL